MPTTVRIRDDDKAALDALQARYTLAMRERISLEDLLSRIVELAEEHEDELILDDTPHKLTPAEMKAFHRGIGHSGTSTSEEDIDEILYGGEDAA